MISSSTITEETALKNKALSTIQLLKLNSNFSLRSSFSNQPNNPSSSLSFPLFSNRKIFPLRVSKRGSEEERLKTQGMGSQRGLSPVSSTSAFSSDVNQKEENREMAMWVFGYGSLIWKPGFKHDDYLVGFIKNYRRVFYQGSTDHRGTPEYPGRTVTLEPADGEVCWGTAYKIIGKEDQEAALMHLEVREKQYDEKAYLDFYTEPMAAIPAVTGILAYIGSSDKKRNKNYLGPASLEDIANQIVHAEGPSGPNRDYLFQLEKALNQLGCKDNHVSDLADEVRRILSAEGN